MNPQCKCRCWYNRRVKSVCLSPPFRNRSQSFKTSSFSFAVMNSASVNMVHHLPSSSFRNSSGAIFSRGVGLNQRSRSIGRPIGPVVVSNSSQGKIAQFLFMTIHKSEEHVLAIKLGAIPSPAIRGKEFTYAMAFPPLLSWAYKGGKLLAESPPSGVCGPVWFRCRGPERHAIRTGGVLHWNASGLAISPRNWDMFCRCSVREIGSDSI